MALPVILIDVLKGFLPAYLALEIFADRRIAIAAAFLAVLGHCFPVYIKFKGGKGVATSMGAYAALAFKPFLISLLLFILIIIISRYVSLGSLLGSLFFPFSVWLLKGENILSFGSLAIFAVIFLRHWSNIGRLLQGKERKFGQKAEV
jgi:glycerol-3-phosphate acyltransferase PlsY